MIEQVLFEVLHYIILIIEVYAVLYILVGVGKGLFNQFDKNKTSEGIIIGKTLDMGLKYLMICEVLASVTATGFDSLLKLGLLLAIRIAIVLINAKELEHEIAIFESNEK